MSETAPQPAKRGMSTGTIVWAVIVLAFSGLAVVYFTTDPKDITPTVVLTYAILAGAVLVAIGILGAIVRLVANRRRGGESNDESDGEQHPPIG